jgi:ATP-dependent DNA ligase
MPPRSSFIEPCLPSTADQPPSGPEWIHEIKHDGYRLMAKRDPVGIRLLTRRGNDWSERFPRVVEAANLLRVRSCLIDGEMSAFRSRRSSWLNGRQPNSMAQHEDRTPTHGYEATREAAVAAFAKSWRRE